MVAVNHNQRVLKLLRDDGYTATVVEHYDFYTKRRYDLFGLIDVLAIGHGETLAIQVTSRSNMSSRRRKMRDSPTLTEMLRAGWRIELWGYDKPTHRWRLKRESLDL